MPLLVMAVFAGLVNGLAVSVAISTISMVQPGQLNLGQLAKLSACILSFWISKEYVLNRTTKIVEGIIQNTRLRILKKIRNTDLLVFEKMDLGRVYSTLSTDAMTISVSAGAVINAGSSLVMLTFIVVLIGSTSMHALLITAAMICVTILYYLHKSQHVGEQLKQASLKENVFFENINGVLKGFKEFKLNRAKSNDFFNRELESIVSETAELRVKAGNAMNHSVLIGQTFLFFTIAGLLFILPSIKPDDIQILGVLVPIVLFSAGPIGDIVVAIPAVSKAQASIKNIETLEQMIDEGSSDIERDIDNAPLRHIEFETLRFSNVSFQYPKMGSRPFKLESFDFELKKGEIVFIVGGNGSGKSTLLKLLTGLYPAETGEVLLNEDQLSPENLANYRNLFTSIFTDFFLFKRILGIDNIDPKRTRKLLEEFELKEKTDIVEGEITNMDLSTGQKKRLALIVATLEDKPICIFDEWAADQDPVFRRYFYNVILPDLKRQGKTVVAVTHDDHYFDKADRVMELDYGTMKPYNGSLKSS